MRYAILGIIGFSLLAGLRPAEGQTRPPAPPRAQERPRTQNPPPARPPRPRLIVPGIGGALSGSRSAGPEGPVFGPPGPRPNFPAPPPGPFPALPGTGQVAPPGVARPLNPFLFGMNVAWDEAGGYAGWDRDNGVRARRLAQLLKEAGVTNVRVRLRWQEIEPQRGQYNWRATDRFLRFLADQRLRPVCLLADIPAWANEANPSPQLYTDVGRFSFAIVSRYRGLAQHWEFLDTPEGKRNAPRPFTREPRVYLQMLRAFAENARRANPTVRIAIGRLKPEQAPFLAALYAAGARPYFDAVALHPGSGPGGLDFDGIDRCRSLMLNNNDAAKTVWITEWGWTIPPDQPDLLSESQHARLIRNTLISMQARPYITQSSYQIFNTTTALDRSLRPFSLLSSTLIPRAGYAAFRAVALGQPMPTATPGFRRVPLISGFPIGEESGGSGSGYRVHGIPANVTVEANRPGEPMPPLWEGYALGNDPGSLSSFEGAVPRLQTVGAKLVRMDPFPNPDMVAPVGGTSGASAQPADFDASRIDFRYADALVDLLARAGAKPMFNFATMPTALSSPTGNPRLPRSPQEWAGFVRAVVRRYNLEQKRGIVYWELSHQPNTGDFSLAEWLRFYETFARTVTAADPNAKVGGPAAAAFGEEWLSGLADYCAKNSVPLHFLSWQAYNQSPAEYARQAETARGILRRHPSLGNVELILGEWNASAAASPDNDGLFAASHALSVVEQLAKAAPVRSLFYAVKDGPNFRDPGVRFWGRWGMLTYDNRPKAVYNAFVMLRRMEGLHLPAVSDDSLIRVMATRGPNSVRVLLWSYPTDPNRSQIADTQVRLQVRSLPWTTGTRGAQWLIDTLRSNPLDNPTSESLAQIASFQSAPGDLEIPIILSPYGATLIELTPARSLPIEVAVETPRYLVYSGASFPLISTVRNLSAQPQTVAFTLTGSDSAVLNPAGIRSRLTLRPNEVRQVRYNIPTTLHRADTQQFFQVAAGEATASIAVRFALPIHARLETARADIQPPGGTLANLPATVPVRAVVENRSDAPIRVRLVAGRTTRALNLPAGQQQVAAVPVPIPEAVPGNYSVPIRVMLEEQSVLTLNAQVSVPAICHFAARTPRINGDLSEWTEAVPIALDRMEMFRGRRWNGMSDLSAQAFAMWDAQNLYLALSVSDDTHFQPFSLNDIARGDSVQFALDTRRSARSPVGSYDENVYEFIMANGTTLPSVLYRVTGGRGRAPELVRAAQVAIQRVGSRTLYEVAIPWTELSPMRPATGMLAGIAIRINDSDGETVGQMEWGAGLSPSRQPGQFIGLLLVK